MAEITLNAEEIQKLKAKVESLSPEEAKKRFFELRKRQKLQQLKQEKNSEKRKEYQARVQEERRQLVALAKKMGWDDEVGEAARSAAETEYSESVEQEEEALA